MYPGDRGFHNVISNNNSIIWRCGPTRSHKVYPVHVVHCRPVVAPRQDGVDKAIGREHASDFIEFGRIAFPK